LSEFKQALREAGLLLLVACVLGFSYTATTEKGLFGKPADTTVVSQTRGAGPQMIELAEAQRLFEAGNALFIDSRHEFDYNLGHIKGAMNIPLKDFDARVAELSALPKNNIIIVYCDGADCNSSIEFASKLFVAGYSSVKIFFGGWREWNASQLPTEKAAP